MRTRLTQYCVPILIILVMAWGTCPCFYAEILSGGLACFDAAPEGSVCSCKSEVADTGVPTLRAVEGPDSDRCPCLDSIGTMHELPQAEDQGSGERGETYLVQAPFAPSLPAFDAESPDLPTGADPGPKLLTVVLLV